LVSFASATTGAQTVAGTVVDTSLSPSWGIYGNCSDLTGEPDPIAACLGGEADVTLNSATTDANKQRVGFQININGIAGSHAGQSLLLGTGGGAISDNGIRYTGSYGKGIDFTGGTFSGDVMTLPTGGVIGAANSITLNAAGGNNLGFNIGGAAIWSITTASSGAFVPGTDNLRDIGTSSARARNVYAVQYYAGANVVGVSCTVGTVNAATMVVTNGIVTHC
jgi:hypothetical protein